jgi:hypothetical protein
MNFFRNFDSIKELKNTRLFKKCLYPDIVEPYDARSEIHGDVFPAIRNKRIDFYHKGGKLFSFTENHGFITHHKYASVLEIPRNAVYVNEEQLMCISNFREGYPRIKENCALHSGAESGGVAGIYSKYSCTKKNRISPIVVLDIEISFKREEEIYAENERARSDRIDFLFFDTRAKSLRFVEAKHYSNNEIRAKGKPKIVAQMNRYSKQLNTDSKRTCILQEFKKHIDVINEIFTNNAPLPTPTIVHEKPLLLIFGFDGKQKEKLKKEIEKLKQEYGLSLYSIGNVNSINERTLDAMFKE